MRVSQQVLTSESDNLQLRPSSGFGCRLLLVFGSPQRFEQFRAAIVQSFPDTIIAGCSTAGEIARDAIHDDSLVVTLLEFTSTRVTAEKVSVQHADETQMAAQALAKQMAHQDLKHVFVFSDGLQVNGSTLASTLNRYLPLGVTVTGGLAGDGSRFVQTAVFDAHGVHHGQIIALGLYGEQIEIGYGSLGGWESFGPERKITRAQGNVLFELDGQSALSLYKMYLGDAAKELPASGLLFPLHLQAGEDKHGVVRTILSVDEKQQSMTFAGDMPVGATVRLMRAHFDRLINGATGAAQLADLQDHPAQFALLVSCVGRRLVLQQRTIDEIRSVQNVLGNNAVLSGFYSYGELCPHGQSLDCNLHNQTMTITSLYERQ